MHAVISGPTSTRTGGEILFSKIDENVTTPSMQHCNTVWTWKLWRANSFQNLLKPLTTEHYFISASKQPLLSRKQCLEVGTAVVELIPISATVSSDGACNNECVIHYEGTTDAAQPGPPSPGIDSDPSATIESSTVLLSQENVDEDTSRA